MTGMSLYVYHKTTAGGFLDCFMWGWVGWEIEPVAWFTHQFCLFYQPKEHFSLYFTEQPKPSQLTLLIIDRYTQKWDRTLTLLRQLTPWRLTTSPDLTPAFLACTWCHAVHVGGIFNNSISLTSFACDFPNGRHSSVLWLSWDSLL